VTAIKQHLAALRGLFNWRHQTGNSENPAMFVKGPRFSRQVGITPIMEADQMRLLLDSIKVTRQTKVSAKHGGGYKEVPDLKGLRDRAAIAIMGHTFARVSAVVGSTLGDYRLEGKRGRLRLMEKGNKEKRVCLHREAEEFLDPWRLQALRTQKLRCSRHWIKHTFCQEKFSGGGTCCAP
jgi:integrase/recombinase XerD